MGTRVTIKDVAKLACCSVGTVSRFLNSGRCLPHRQKKIEEAIRVLGYTPNLNARATRAERSGSIGILIEQHSAGDCFWVQSLLMALLTNLSNSKYRSFVQIVDPAAAPRQVMSLPGNIDGVVLIGHFPDEFCRDLERFHIPAVTYWEPLPYENGISLGVELESGMRRLVEYLFSLGHSKIGVAGNTSGINPEKVAVFKKIIRGYRPDYADDLIVLKSGGAPDCGRAATAELLDRHPDLTAIFYLSDSIVLGGMGELARRRLSVPGDIGIVSFDNSFLSENMAPQLTCVGFCYDELASGLLCALQNRFLPTSTSRESEDARIVLNFYAGKSVEACCDRRTCVSRAAEQRTPLISSYSTQKCKG